MTLWNDLKFAARSLTRTKGLTITVVLTLALGIGANAAIFTLVRGVLLRPLVNRDEDRLIYIRQSARGIGVENATFSVPGDPGPARARQDAQRVRRFLDHRLHHGRAGRAARSPRRRGRRIVLRGDGTASGARPAARHAGRRTERGRRGGADLSLLDARSCKSDPSVLGKTVRLGDAHGHHRRRAGTVGAVSGGDRNHRQRRDQPASSLGDHGDRAGPSHDGAVRPAGARRDSRAGARRAAHGVRERC